MKSNYNITHTRIYIYEGEKERENKEEMDANIYNVEGLL